MTALLDASRKRKIWKETQGQEITEYALLGGFLAAACGAVLPTVAISIGTVLTKVVTMLAATAPGSFPGA